MRTQVSVYIHYICFQDNVNGAFANDDEVEDEKIGNVSLFWY